jgi:hypothetical protein
LLTFIADPNVTENSNPVYFDFAGKKAAFSEKNIFHFRNGIILVTI